MATHGALEPGSLLGPYAIVGRLGEGGMGEVYRAHDPKLKRDVAIKVVRAGLTDPERHARFEREARILAALGHPHIAAIYGLDEAGGQVALVLELVEGQTLADRLRHGPVPIDEALRFAGQMADALEYAHERGIVHRDLKPANVKITADGAVKILDFGLAKAVAPDAAPDAGADAPTVTHGMTELGVILGTPAYMSPEQATGRAVDRRTDVWAFGCVLFEMLTGTRPFRGETATDTVAAVLGGEPDWSALPPATPAEIARLVRRCLRKDPRQRLQSIGDARIAIGEVVAGTASGERPAPVARPASRRLLQTLAGALLLVVGTAAVVWQLKPASDLPAPLVAFTIALPAGQALAALDSGTLAFSDDSRELAYVATGNDRQQIYLRAMETGETTAVAGTEGAAMPFFSPDGQWLGFFANGRLKKVPLKGGSVTTLTDVPSAFGATWSTDRSIVFASLWSALQRMPDGPGSGPKDLTQFAGTENFHAWPRVVPGQPSVLFMSTGPAAGAIAVADLKSGAHHDVLLGPGLASPSYVNGHLVYVQGANLMAMPVDLARQAAQGVGALMIPNVRQYAVSGSGSLAYASGRAPGDQSRLVWVSRAGTAEVIDDRADAYYQPRLDPVRGSRVVTDLKEQVWMFDLSTRNLTPFTFGDRNQHAIWTRDGRRLVFMTQKGRTWQLSTQPADGSGEPEALTSDAGRLDIPYSLTPDGALAYVKYSGTAESQMWILPLASPGAAARPSRQVSTIPIVDAEAGPVFSPDGHWLAYAGSDDAGRRQIYVQAYPGPGGKHQVSIDGGNEPLWNPVARGRTLELFYRNGDDMMAIDITTEGGFGQAKPHRLFSGAAAYRPVKGNFVRANYDVSPDGQRFLMLQPVGEREAPVTEIHVIVNWGARLQQLAAGGR